MVILNTELWKIHNWILVLLALHCNTIIAVFFIRQLCVASKIDQPAVLSLYTVNCMSARIEIFSRLSMMFVAEMPWIWNSRANYGIFLIFLGQHTAGGDGQELYGLAFWNGDNSPAVTTMVYINFRGITQRGRIDYISTYGKSSVQWSSSLWVNWHLFLSIGLRGSYRKSQKIWTKYGKCTKNDVYH